LDCRFGGEALTVQSTTSPSAWAPRGPEEASGMIILGLILLIIGLVAKIGILTTIGIILLIIGAVLWLLGSVGRPVGGRRWYW
jgi:hypothetical protein